MDELTKALSLALVGVIAALVTQWLLRWDQTRRETRAHLLERLALEQSLTERLAYRAASLIWELSEAKERPAKAEVYSRLFDQIGTESKLTTFIAELTAYGVHTGDYRKKTHAFREECKKICFAILDQHLEGKDNGFDATTYIKTVKDLVRDHSTTAVSLTKEIFFAFRVL